MTPQPGSKLDIASLVGITDRLARIETKLDALLSDMPDVKDRVDALEDSKTRERGIIMGISLAVSVIWHSITAVFGSNPFGRNGSGH